MNRRRLLQGPAAGLGVAALASLIASPALAQPVVPARVGLLTLASARAAAPFIDRLRDSLRELGHHEGRQVVYDVRSAEGRIERLEPLAADLVARKPHLVVAGGGNVSAYALLRSTASIPIVMTAGFGVVEAGLAQSLARPGGMVTGVSVPAELGLKLFELMREVLPSATRIAVMVLDDPREAARREQARALLRQAYQIEIEYFVLRGLADMPRVLQALRAARPQGLIVVPDPVTYQLRHEILRFARAERLPDVHALSEDVEDGGLMALHLNLQELMVIVSRQCDRLLKGAKPADLPFEQPTRLEVAVNLKTARSLGLTIPRAVLQRAELIVE